jgi:hypothetical protein
MASFEISLLPGRFEIHQLSPESDWKDLAPAGGFFSVTATGDELSVVTEEGRLTNMRSEKGWRCLKVHGPFEFGVTGVIASLSNCLADTGIPIFVVSTFDTDYILLKEAYLESAKKALAACGHRPGW